MNKKPLNDARAKATRQIALEAGLELLEKEGLLAITHASISQKTGISRSTLYRHWPKTGHLRKACLLRAATSPSVPPRTNGPLRADLFWVLGNLLAALNDTPWGRVVPQIIALSEHDAEVKRLINDFQSERRQGLKQVFDHAMARGELRLDAPIDDLIEMAISVPYYRKLMAGLPLDHQWLESHVSNLCKIAMQNLSDEN